MPVSRFILPVLTMSLALASATHAQASGGLKPGLWESRVLKLNVNGQDMLSQMSAMQEQMRQAMAKMSPAERKQMEAMMGAQMADPMMQRICISPEMAARDESILPRPEDAQCEQPKIKRSGQRTTFEVACKTREGPMLTKGESLVSGDRVDTKVETVVTTAGGGRQVSLTESTMKYLGKDCGSVKPVEQIIQDAEALIGKPR